MNFSPAVYEHAARLIGLSPWSVSRDADLLARAHIQAFQTYRHSPVVVGIDIYNLEAQAYGAVVDEPTGVGIPAISRHPFTSAADLLKLPPFDPDSAGRIPLVLNAAKTVAKNCPNADVRIPLSGPFSLAANLLGLENLLCDLFQNPDIVIRALYHLVVGQVNFARCIKDAGLDVAFFESAASPPMLSPDQFLHVELEPLKQILQQTAQVVEHPVPCIMGGDTLAILDDLIATGTGYLICPFETDQKTFMQDMQKASHIRVRINMDPHPLSTNDFPAACREIDRIVSIANDYPNACIGTGCVPYETEPEFLLKLRDYALSV